MLFSRLQRYVRKMATPDRKVFCVLQFAKSESVISVQCAFRVKFNCDPPCGKNIRRWYSQFETTGCVCKGKSTGRPTVSEANVDRVRASYLRSPKKTVQKASLELQLPKTTVWKVLRKRLNMRPYRLQLVHALMPDDYGVRYNFEYEVLQRKDFLVRMVFSDESTFHLSGKVNTHNVRIWGTEHPHELVQYQRDSPKLNVFCAVSRRQMYGPVFSLKLP